MGNAFATPTTDCSCLPTEGGCLSMCGSLPPVPKLHTPAEPKRLFTAQSSGSVFDTSIQQQKFQSISPLHM